ncbi:hypothetical protein P9112_006068 [Eukaryota sp. TZLM1-RC]
MGRFDRLNWEDIPDFRPMPRDRFATVTKLGFPEFPPKVVTASATLATLQRPTVSDSSIDAPSSLPHGPVVPPNIIKLLNHQRSQGILPVTSNITSEPHASHSDGLESDQTDISDDDDDCYPAPSTPSSRPGMIQYSKDTLLQMKDHCPADNQLTKRILECIFLHNNLSLNSNRSNRFGNHRGGAKRGQSRGNCHLHKKERQENQYRPLAEQKTRGEESRRSGNDSLSMANGRKGRRQDIRNPRQPQLAPEIIVDKVKGFIKKLDRMGIEDAISDYAQFGVGSDQHKAELLALVLYTFINKNPPVVMINHFLSIIKGLVERNLITKSIIAVGFNKFMETKIEELMEDFPLCTAVIAKFVIFWLRKGYINHSNVVDAFSKIKDEFTREDLLKPFKADLEEIGEDVEWLVLR